MAGAGSFQWVAVDFQYRKGKNYLAARALWQFETTHRVLYKIKCLVICSSQ